jgi:hypothetical protein
MVKDAGYGYQVVASLLSVFLFLTPSRPLHSLSSLLPLLTAGCAGTTSAIQKPFLFQPLLLRARLLLTPPSVPKASSLPADSSPASLAPLTCLTPYHRGRRP